VRKVRKSINTKIKGKQETKLRRNKLSNPGVEPGSARTIRRTSPAMPIALFCLKLFTTYYTYFLFLLFPFSFSASTLSVSFLFYKFSFFQFASHFLSSYFHSFICFSYFMFASHFVSWLLNFSLPCHFFSLCLIFEYPF
jgi:hypothetical protein